MELEAQKQRGTETTMINKGTRGLIAPREAGKELNLAAVLSHEGGIIHLHPA